LPADIAFPAVKIYQLFIPAMIIFAVCLPVVFYDVASKKVAEGTGYVSS
jgi:hypothetical protein